MWPNVYASRPQDLQNGCLADAKFFTNCQGADVAPFVSIDDLLAKLLRDASPARRYARRRTSGRRTCRASGVEIDPGQHYQISPGFSANPGLKAFEN
jgi:hypothetical protein